MSGELTRQSYRGEGAPAEAIVMERRLSAALEALRFYADEESWHLPDDPMSSTTPVDEDRGDRARAALAASDE